jgi:hypothetical protein
MYVYSIGDTVITPDGIQAVVCEHVADCYDVYKVEYINGDHDYYDVSQLTTLR